MAVFLRLLSFFFFFFFFLFQKRPVLISRSVSRSVCSIFERVLFCFSFHVIKYLSGALGWLFFCACCLFFFFFFCLFQKRPDMQKKQQKKTGSKHIIFLKQINA